MNKSAWALILIVVASTACVVPAVANGLQLDDPRDNSLPDPRDNSLPEPKSQGQYYDNWNLIGGGVWRTVDCESQVVIWRLRGGLSNRNYCSTD